MINKARWKINDKFKTFMNGLQKLEKSHKINFQ